MTLLLNISLWKRRGIDAWNKTNLCRIITNKRKWPPEMTYNSTVSWSNFCWFFSFRVLIAQKKFEFFCTHFPPGLSELRHEVRRLETQVWINWNMSSFHLLKSTLWELQVHYSMSQLTRQVKRRDRLRHRRERRYNLLTAILQASSPKRSESPQIRWKF